MFFSPVILEALFDSLYLNLKGSTYQHWVGLTNTTRCKVTDTTPNKFSFIFQFDLRDYKYICEEKR